MENNLTYEELMQQDYGVKLRALMKVEGLSEDDFMAIINNPDISLRDDMIDIILTVDNTTNEMTRLGQRIEWTTFNNTYRVINSNIQDCFDQANTATDILRGRNFNKTWDLITPGLNSEVSGMGHAWGKIYSGNGSFITFDPRSRSFGVNRVCDSCHGWFGL